MLSAAEHDRWLRIARKYTRAGIEASDVLQEACLAAMRSGRADLSTPPNQRYFRGIIRKTAWAMMRADTRRKRHEQSQPFTDKTEVGVDSNGAPDLSQLPISLQAVGNLVMANLDRNEIRAALGISDDALRRRLADLRRHIEKHSLSFEAFESTIRAHQQLAPEDVGLIRQALLQWLKHGSGTQNAVATVDPDGHLIAIKEKSPDPLTNLPPPATEG
jgi:DNA-directed RNA polymerase specialized sigma24 family protein